MEKSRSSTQVAFVVVALAVNSTDLDRLPRGREEVRALRDREEIFVFTSVSNIIERKK